MQAAVGQQNAFGVFIGDLHFGGDGMRAVLQVYRRPLTDGCSQRDNR